MKVKNVIYWSGQMGLKRFKMEYNIFNQKWQLLKRKPHTGDGQRWI